LVGKNLEWLVLQGKSMGLAGKFRGDDGVLSAVT